MKNIIKFLSVSSYGLKYKLRVIFYLVSVLPTLISLYIISSYIMPVTGIQLGWALFVVVSIVVAFSGFALIRQLVDPILSISSRAQKIVRGDVDYEIEAERQDEIGDLENALAHLTSRIKDDMKALEKYGEETKQINLDINRKVVALSGLLQISSFISESVEIDEILDLSAEKMLQIGDSDLAFIVLEDELSKHWVIESASGLNAQRLSGKKFNPKEDSLFSRIINGGRDFSLEKTTPRNAAIDKFQGEFGVDSAFFAPLSVHNRIIGVAVVANNRGFIYKNDTLNLIDIFVKQIIIAVENRVLAKKVSHLEVKDALTGLYNESFIRMRLDEEINRAIAYQRPCAFILFGIDNYKEIRDRFSGNVVGSIFKKIAVALKEGISDVDRAARFSDSEFAVILPEKNKRQAQAVAEEVRVKIDYLFKADAVLERKISIKIGVSENPIDGVTAIDLINKAKEVLA